jgi:hypothetical protein
LLWAFGPFTQAIFAAIFSELGTFITDQLLHIVQKDKIAAKIVCVNGPLMRKSAMCNLQLKMVGLMLI